MDDPQEETPEEGGEPDSDLDAASSQTNIHWLPPIPPNLVHRGHDVSLPRRARSGYGNEPPTSSPKDRNDKANADPLSRTEKVKLLAGYLNTVASGLMVTGVVGPIANYLYGTTSTTSRSPWWLVGEIIALITASVCPSHGAQSSGKARSMTLDWIVAFVVAPGAIVLTAGLLVFLTGRTDGRHRQTRPRRPAPPFDRAA